MIIYTLKQDAKYLGEEDEKYGYTVWVNVNEIDIPVMFNTRKTNLLAGTQIVAQEQEAKKSAKGNDYYRLKKVSIGEAQTMPLEAPRDDASELLRVKLEAMQGDIKLLLSMVRGLQKASDKAVDEQDITIDDIPDV